MRLTSANDYEISRFQIIAYHCSMLSFDGVAHSHVLCMRWDEVRAQE